MKSLQYFLSVLAIALATTCVAAEFSIDFDKSPSVGVVTALVHVRGPIVEGDTERMRKLILRSQANMITVSLDSPGGNVKEAIAMAAMVRRLYAATLVEPERLCASACFFVWLAGSPRICRSVEELERWKEFQILRPDLNLSPDFGVVGLHRPYLTNLQSADNDQAKVMRIVRDYLDEQLVSRRLIDIMLSRPSNDIYWLTEIDRKELGRYPPNVEEFLIAQCGYDRNARPILDERNGEKALQDIRRSADCQLSKLKDLRIQRLSELRKPVP